jgi:hypothetical protein
MLLARVIENQADDECPHDRPPLLDWGHYQRVMFHVGFASPEKWLLNSPGKANRSIMAAPGTQRAHAATNQKGPVEDIPLSSLILWDYLVSAVGLEPTTP